ncbi:hypothetical protein [Arthrobacter sp. NA-172]|uniref:hypothetical protein n=1 Tax=Arthrobacter sp. NA-172 TaxID=3367524 RepID=UPI003754C8E8
MSLHDAIEKLADRLWDEGSDEAALNVVADLRAALAANPAPETEWGVRRDQDSPCHSKEYAEQTIAMQRKRKLKPVLIKREVGPWGVAE